MRKVLAVILALTLTIVLGSVSVFAASSVVSTQVGKVAATGTWDNNVPRVADGDSLVINDSGDCYGYVFDNVTPGVYKIAFYISLDSNKEGTQMRVSPRVQSTTLSERRCWIDWRWTPSLVQAYSDSGLNKVLLVSVINVPENYNKIDAGFWQDNGSFSGKLEKVVLAKADANLYDANYFLMGEQNYRMNAADNDDHSNNTFDQDPGQEILAPAGSWTVSAPVADNGNTDNSNTGDNSGTTKPTTAPADNSNTGNDNNAKTGDAGTLLALITAGAASIGGLMLRKKK